MLDNTLMSTTDPTNPCEIALQSLWKQLKSRLFRGFYMERHYVEDINDYRDIVSLQKSEKSLDKTLRDIKEKLQLFYGHRYPKIWIGITSGTLKGIKTLQPSALETYLWVEIKDLAFGHYWFSIKGIHFRGNEIILKLKEVQLIEEEVTPAWSPSTATNKYLCAETNDTLEASTISSISGPYQITHVDFKLLLQQWWASIKQTVYNFMAEDINKENIKEVLRFMGLLIITVLAGAVAGAKFLGIFTLRFMLELRRLIKTLTPIIFKIIDMLNKIIGGFYILLSMIWRDTGRLNRDQRKYNHVVYNRPTYRVIQHRSSPRWVNID